MLWWWCCLNPPARPLGLWPDGLAVWVLQHHHHSTTEIPFLHAPTPTCSHKQLEVLCVRAPMIPSKLRLLRDHVCSHTQVLKLACVCMCVGVCKKGISCLCAHVTCTCAWGCASTWSPDYWVNNPILPQISGQISILQAKWIICHLFVGKMDYCPIIDLRCMCTLTCTCTPPSACTCLHMHACVCMHMCKHMHMRTLACTCASRRMHTTVNNPAVPFLALKFSS